MADAPATAWPTIKLQTNVPLLGLLKYADYRQGRDWADPDEGGKIKKLPDQISLRGLWGEEGKTLAQATLYVPLAFVAELCAMGALVASKENDAKGNPRYTVGSPGRGLRIVKREQGKKKPVHIHWQGEPEGAPAGATPPAQPAAASSAAPAPAKPAQTPREQRPGKLQTAAEIERDAAIQLLKSAKTGRIRLTELTTTFEGCLAAAELAWQRFLRLHEPAKNVNEDHYLDLVERVAVHFSIQLAQERVQVVSREKLAELRRIAGLPEKTKEKPRMEPPPPTAPVVDDTPHPLPPSEREPMSLDAFDEDASFNQETPDMDYEDDNDLPF